jgi:hypothetical protein
MKRLTILLPAALLFGLGCESPPTAVSAGRSGTPNFSAITSGSNTIVQVELFVFVPCANGGAGEVIDVSGPLHIVMTTIISDAGNFHAKFHFQPQGISGFGLVTGDKYQATGVTQEEFSIEGVLPITETFVNNFRMIGQGPGNNFLVHENFHITIDANGVLSAFQDNFSIECK